MTTDVTGAAATVDAAADDSDGIGALTVERRTELLARSDAAEVVELAETCIDRVGMPTVLTGPDVGTVMMRVREPVVGERFDLGEVVVVRTEVDVAGKRGWSMRLGTDRVASLAAAVCEAAASADERCAADVDALCRLTAERQRTAATDEWSELAETEVHFEELD